MLVTASSIFLTNPVVSATATLTVIPDTNAPVATASYAEVTNSVEITFNEPLDPTTAGDSTRYTLNGGATVQTATLLPDNQSVLLSVSGLTAPTYLVSFSGIADPYGNLATGSLSGTNAGMILEDVGTVALPGWVAATNAARFTVSATGSNIFGTADSFTYVCTNLTGDFDLRVQVDNITGGNSNTRGGPVLLLGNVSCAFLQWFLRNRRRQTGLPVVSDKIR